MAKTRSKVRIKPRPLQPASHVKSAKRTATPAAVPWGAQRGQELGQKILTWYLENRRDLPWRKNRDPYRIWISEVMLQQTTVTTVIPYYERFLTTFPRLQDLAQAPLEQVLELWTGLGYYSRARNLHKAAQALSQTDWPRSHVQLLEKPGFGPYTARAVSSLAFGEQVGVLDGNVIRVLSRVSGQAITHWTGPGREQLQSMADQVAQSGDSASINQGLMELGATLCTPKNPQCLLCPWFDLCVARKESRTDVLPLKKPRKQLETWVWSPTIFRRGDKVALIKNDYAPFLRGQWIFPGRAEWHAQKPKQFDLRHGITHHEIYVQISEGKSPRPKGMEWVLIQDLTKWNPSILLRKTLDTRTERAPMSSRTKRAPISGRMEQVQMRPAGRASILSVERRTKTR